MAGERTRFQTGNNAARKYSLEQAREIFRRVHDDILYDEEVVYLNQSLNRLGYYAHLLQYLINIYGDDEEIVEYADRIASLLEERIVIKSLTGKIKEATAIFVMKARFNMHETQRIQQVSDDEGGKVSRELLDNTDPALLEQLRELVIKIEQGDGAGDSEAEARVVE